MSFQQVPPSVDPGSTGGSAGIPSGATGGGAGGGAGGGGGGGGAALGGGDGLPPPVAPMDPAMFAALPHGTSTGPIIAVSIICILVATTAVTLRVYTRHFLLNRVGPDDFMAVAALAAITALGAITIIHTNFGLGSHIYDIVATDPLLIMDFFKFFYLGVVVYNVSLIFVKLSLFLQYYRLVDQVPRYRPLFLCAGFVVMGWTVAMVFTMTFICVPVYAYWDKSVPHVCLSDPVMQLTNSVGNIVTDVMLLLLPMPVLWNLRLPPRQKWSVIAIFSLGFITCIVSLLRVIFVFDHGPSSDITFDGVTITGWTIAEVTTGLLASSLITLRPLMSKIAPAAWRTGKSSNATTTTNTNKNTNRNTTNKTNGDAENNNINIGNAEDNKAGAFLQSSNMDKGGLAENEPPIQMHPVLSQQQSQFPQQPQRPWQQQHQDDEVYSTNSTYRPDSAPSIETIESTGAASGSSSDVELMIQKPTTPATSSHDLQQQQQQKRQHRKTRSATLTTAPEGWGPPPPAPPFYFSEQQEQQQYSQNPQQRRSQRQQEYQRHRQSRSATYFQNTDYDANTIGSDQIGLGFSSPNHDNDPLGSQRSGLQGGPAALRANPEHRRHASTKSADRIISLHPSYSGASNSTTTTTTSPPPPPPPKSPWAMAAARPPPPSIPRMMEDEPLPPLPMAAPNNPLPAAPRGGVPRPPPKHSHSQSSSSMRSDISYEVKVWSQKGAGGPYEGVDDRRF
ncbi:hypothetical protein PG985_016402 [Apiospora marii]|uniref:uncharacterized protein n=1 Tax=Apiospora marii TaxID=335849 RepID=UPI0031300358